MKNEDLEKFEELYSMLQKRAEKIALLKNEYSVYKIHDIDDVKFDYGYGEWEVTLTKRSTCHCCDDESTYFDVTKEEMLSDLDVLKQKYKDDYNKKIEETERLKKEQEEKERLKNIAREFEYYKKLKEKYEDSNKI